MADSQLHPFRTLKGQWGTPVFLRRRVGSRSVRYRLIFALKHHRMLAMFWECFRRFCQRPHRAFGSRSVPGTGTPAIFGGERSAQARKKASEGHPQKVVTVVTVVTFVGFCLLKSCHRPPWATPKVVTVVTSWGPPPIPITYAFPFSKHPPKHIEAHCHPLNFRP